ncbi:oligosaccharide flippase family protein [Shewanella electrodiphila]|uniref:Oligosaccharide flippase family protein n=1 Tax=Shewanella electrodiphila TaxID=934143 RepID=A0ABT0KKM5_9GAMM|nr:oligosaccharide flippase family protein [Shewanella electrodiphila]MCL1044141.1 oligosaccharide flippase family protein [Shewanella electrodiphila]
MFEFHKKKKSIISAVSFDSRFFDIIKGASYTFIFKILGVFLGFVTNLYLARNYGAEAVGILAVFTTIYIFGSLFSHIGFSTSLLRIVPESKQDKLNSVGRTVTKVYFLITLSSIFVSVLMYTLSESLSLYFFDGKYLDLLGLGSLFFFFFSIYNINLILYRAKEEVRSFAFFQFFQPFLFLCLVISIGFGWLDYSNTIVYSLFITYLILFVITSKQLIGLITIEEKETKYSLKDLVIMSLPMFITSSMWLIISQTDILMLSSMVGNDEVGIYSIVAKIGMLVSFILTSVNMILAPKIALLYYNSDEIGLKELTKKTARLTFYITLPIILILLVFGKFILALFGSEFVSGYYALVIISFGQLVGCACGSVGHFLNMTGSQVIFNKIMMFATVINVFLNYTLIPYYGLVGASVASLISIVFWNLASRYVIYKKFGYSIGVF